MCLVVPVISEGTLDYITNTICCWRFCRNTNCFVNYILDVSYFIEYRYIFLNICSDNVLVSVGYNYVNPIAFYCELSTWYILQDLFVCCWLLSSNAKDPYIRPIYSRKTMITRASVCWLVDIGHVVMLKVFGNDANMSTSLWKIYSNFKYTIFDEGVIWEIDFNVWRVEIFVPVISLEPGDHPFTNLLLCSSKFPDEKYSSLLVCGSYYFIAALLLV